LVPYKKQPKPLYQFRLVYKKQLKKTKKTAADINIPLQHLNDPKVSVKRYYGSLFNLYSSVLQSRHPMRVPPSYPLSTRPARHAPSVTVLIVRTVVCGYSIKFLRKIGLSIQNTRIMSSSEYSQLPCFPYAVFYGLPPSTLARTCLATPPIPLTLSHSGCPPAVHTSAAPEHVLGHCSWQGPCPQPKVVTPSHSPLSKKQKSLALLLCSLAP